MDVVVDVVVDERHGTKVAPAREFEGDRVLYGEKSYFPFEISIRYGSQPRGSAPSASLTARK